MADCAVDKSTSGEQATVSGSSWSVGVIASAGTQLPDVCLRQCLNGDSSLASTHGCTMLKCLVERAKARPGASYPAPAGSDLPGTHVDPPAICDRGYAVLLSESEGMGSPDVLILRPAGPSGEVEEALAPVIETVRSAAAENWRLGRENDGLADEVLRGYEQINLIFDISAQIAVLSNADEVRRMLLTKLRHLFNADAAYLISPDQGTALEVRGDGEVRHGWMASEASVRAACSESGEAGSPEATDPESRESGDAGISGMGRSSSFELPPESAWARKRLQESQRVLVYSEDQAYQEAGHGTTMWGPLNDGRKGATVIGVVRRQAPFIAGDMLLLDSTLTYGSHILSNLRLVEQLQQSSFEAVRALVTAIDAKDSYTCGHSERVGSLAKVIGEFMGLPSKQLKELEWAALVHDVGKIGIPEEVLNKPGRLTEEEFALIKGHPPRGFEILHPVASLEPVLAGVLHHHENPDGTGYPDGLKGDEIPLMARIIHVVDVFDALTSTRSYRKAYEVDRAISIIKKDAGTKLDAEIVGYFLGAWARFPNTHPEEYKRWLDSAKEAVA